MASGRALSRRRHRTAPIRKQPAQEDWLTLPGAVLATAGLPMPTLDPEQALLIEVRRQD
ncbi:hypothetical protein [Streptomyces sp. NPDC088794]|uniref:hypothetical protein n=1 Tax=Streptomyces sp. NPDC088794 TaxID=3365902 RepID=UPI00380BC9AE